MMLNNRIALFAKKFYLINDFYSRLSYSKPKEPPKPIESLFDRSLRNDLGVDSGDKAPIEYLFPNTIKKFQPFVDKNQRCGALGIKLGLSHLWNIQSAKQLICTMIHIPECQVLQHYVNTHPTNGYRKHTLIVGVGKATEQDKIYFNSDTLDFYNHLGIEPKLGYRGFHVHPDHVLPVGTVIGSSHFSPGQQLKISSVTKDRGFLGVMQRWDFKGNRQSHGVSKYHRGRGSICNRKAQVHVGTKMAGHTGLKSRFVNGVRVLRINTKHNVIYIQGSIPGPIGQIVTLRDWWSHPSTIKINYPTFTGDTDSLPEDLFAPGIHDPSQMMKPIFEKFSK